MPKSLPLSTRANQVALGFINGFAKESYFPQIDVQFRLLREKVF